MWHFHHARNREQEQTISQVKLNISAHTPQVLPNNSPFFHVFTVMWLCNSSPPTHTLFGFVQEASVLYGHLCY